MKRKTRRANHGWPDFGQNVKRARARTIDLTQAQVFDERGVLPVSLVAAELLDNDLAHPGRNLLSGPLLGRLLSELA